MGCEDFKEEGEQNSEDFAFKVISQGEKLWIQKLRLSLQDRFFMINNI